MNRYAIDILERDKEQCRKLGFKKVFIDDLQQAIDLLNSKVIAEGNVDYELDPIEFPYNGSIGTVSIEDIIYDAISGKCGKKVKILVQVEE